MGVSGAKSDMAESKAFRINLFPDTDAFMKSEGGGSKGDSDSSNFIMIDIDGTADSKTFERYMQDLDLKEETGGGRVGAKSVHDEEEDDLLALMDSCK
jgi:hypothetical protein